MNTLKIGVFGKVQRGDLRVRLRKLSSGVRRSHILRGKSSWIFITVSPLFVTKLITFVGDKIANLRNHYETNKGKRAKSKSKKKCSKFKSKKKRTIEKLNYLEKLKGKFYFASKLELDKLREKQNASKMTAATQPIM